MPYYLILTFDLSQPKTNIYYHIDKFLETRSFIKDSTHNTYKSAEYDLDSCAEYYFPSQDNIDEEVVLEKILSQEREAFQNFLNSEGVVANINIFPVQCSFNSVFSNK